MDLKPLIDNLLSKKWVSLHHQRETKFADVENNGQYPGVYILAYSDKSLYGQPIEIRDVFYVGMSNSRGGVKQRLKQFLDGIERNRLHSAAMRFFKEHASHTPWSQFSENNGGRRFYVASVTLRCEVKKANRIAEDLRKMGHVAALEYYVLAHIKEELGTEPDLNEK
jgi:hypothetical protein